MLAVTCMIHHMHAWYLHHSLHMCCVIRCVGIATSVWLQGFCSVYTRSVYEVCVNAAIMYIGPLWHIIYPFRPVSVKPQSCTGLRHRIPIMTVSAYSDSTTHCQDGLFGQPSVPLRTCVHPQKELINNIYNTNKNERLTNVTQHTPA